MSKTDKFMPLYAGDYLADTTMLTRDQHGGYFLLILAYWRNRGPLPDNDEALAMASRSSVEDWVRLRPVLARFFRVRDGVWRHKRIDDELEKAAERYDRTVERAKAGAAKRWSRQPGSNATSNATSNAPGMPQAMLKQCQPQPHLKSQGKPCESARARWPSDAVVPETWIELARGQRRSLGLADMDLALAARMFGNFYAADVNARSPAEWQAKWINWALKEKPDASRPRSGSTTGDTLRELARMVGECEGDTDRDGFGG